MATKAKKPKEKYKPNTFVVHPHHGAAKVIRKVNKNVEIFVEGEPKSKRIQYFEIEVLMDGKNITNLPLPIRSRLGLGYLTQEASIFRDLTVKDNIDLALQNSSYSRAAIRNRREQLINEFNLNKFVDNYGYQLSGGERRRCEIARALTVGRKGPKYLLLDEPFAGIDPLAVNDLKKLILKLSSYGVGILITDHNVRETLLITNKSYVLSEGKILANGSSSELADNPIVKKYYLGDNFKL